MKRNLITLGVALAIVAAIVVINRFDPGKRTDAQINASADTEEQLSAAERALAQLQGDDENEKTPEVKAATRDDVKDKDVIQILFECSNGNFKMEVYREWAPLGVEQFLKAIEDGVYDGAHFFRVVPGFVVQFGIPGDPDLATKWRKNPIKDDPVLKPNERGTICFATSGKDSRTTQVFINYGDNRRLDEMGFAPFGKIVDGMDTVDGIEDKYRESPNQGLIQRRGNEYLDSSFPDMDYIKKVTILAPEGR